MHDWKIALNAKLKKLIFILIPIFFLLFVVEGFVRLIKIPVLQDESYYFGFSGCPKYFQKVKTVDNNFIYQTNQKKISNSHGLMRIKPRMNSEFSCLADQRLTVNLMDPKEHFLSGFRNDCRLSIHRKHIKSSTAAERALDLCG